MPIAAPFGSVDQIMRPDLYGNDRVLADEELEGDSVADIYGNGVQVFEFAGQLVQPQRRMGRICLEQSKGLFILAEQFGMTLGEPLCSADIRLGEDKPRHR